MYPWRTIISFQARSVVVRACKSVKLLAPPNTVQSITPNLINISTYYYMTRSIANHKYSVTRCSRLYICATFTLAFSAIAFLPRSYVRAKYKSLPPRHSTNRLTLITCTALPSSASLTNFRFCDLEFALPQVPASVQRCDINCKPQTKRISHK
jgi:hypothetical protein